MMAALKNRRFLVFGGAALLCIIFLLVTVMVHARQSVSLYGMRKQALEQLNELRQSVQTVDFDKLQEQNDELVAQLSEIERSLPEAEYVPTLIRQIESGAAMTGNDLIELRQGEIRQGKLAPGPGAPAEAAPAQPGEAAKQPGQEGKEPEAVQGQRYDEMDIEIQFDGSFRGAFDFIKHLGTLGKIISVESVEIEKAGEEEFRPDGQAAARVKLSAKAYILAPQTGFPGELSMKVF